MSTLAQPTDEIGRSAATCLIERLHGLHGLDVLPRELLWPGRWWCRDRR